MTKNIKYIIIILAFSNCTSDKGNLSAIKTSEENSNNQNIEFLESKNKNDTINILKEKFRINYNKRTGACVTDTLYFNDLKFKVFGKIFKPKLKREMQSIIVDSIEIVDSMKSVLISDGIILRVNQNNGLA